MIGGDLAKWRLCETRPEKLKSELQGLRAGGGVGFLGRGSKLPPHQLRDLRECCKLAPWGPGEATGKCGFGASRGLKIKYSRHFTVGWPFSAFGVVQTFILQSPGGGFVDPSSTSLMTPLSLTDAFGDKLDKTDF